MSDYRPTEDPYLQPYRDPETGQVVTLTPAQCAAVQHAFSVYNRVVQIELDKHSNPNPAFDVAHAYFLATVSKSRLMGRLLYDGLPPLVDAPPIVDGGPDYSVAVAR